MKTIILVLVLVLLLALNSPAFAASSTTLDGTTCDWSKIVENTDGTYTYSKALNLCVGKTVQDSQVKDQQIVDYKQAIDLYKLTIKTDEERIQNWINTSVQLGNRVATIDELEKKNQWLYFGLGIATAAAAVWGAGQLR